MNNQDFPSSRNERTIRINDSIRSPRVILIDQNGNNKGEISCQEAKRQAMEINMDLVEVKPGNKEIGEWPICKIIDYGKMKYEESKKKQNSKSPVLKEIMFHYSTQEHDLSIKRDKISKFLAKGHQVKFSIILKGRECRYKTEARQILEQQIEKLQQVGKAEKIIESDRSMHATLSPIR